ncbi:hypothetical protein QBC45DRAFT_441408 [Copromyces sp. CBS 386.78]|nr:hypothetical protein QBC45DRAFT_441408 [Copromyces sp. CBS 386.78]
MFSSLVFSAGAILAMFQALPTTTLAFPTADPDSNSNSNSPSSIPDYFIQGDGPPPPPAATLNVTSTSTLLEARMKTFREIVDHDCDNTGNGNSKWGYAESRRVWEGIYHLRKNPKVENQLDSYDDIAWAAEQVSSKCFYAGTGENTGTPAMTNNKGGYLKGAVYMKVRVYTNCESSQGQVPATETQYPPRAYSLMMSRRRATDQTKNSESLLRHDLEGFSRDLLGLHTRFQEMFPVLASRDESASTSASVSAPVPTPAPGLDALLAYQRHVAARTNASQPPTPALTPSQSASPLPADMERKIRRVVNAKIGQEIDEINVRFTHLENQFELRVDDIYKDVVEPLKAEKKRVEEELAKLREESTKRQQAEEKTREELWGVIRKMQGDIEELKKGHVQKSVKAKKVLRKEPVITDEEWARLESPELRPRSMKGPTSREENVQNYTSFALVPFSSQIDKTRNALNPNELGQSRTPPSVVSDLDLTTRPANRGQQSVAGLQNTHSADSEHTIPTSRSHSGRHWGLLPEYSSSDEDSSSESTTSEIVETSAKRGSTSQTDHRLGRHSATSRSRSPRRVDANFRVRDGSQPISKSISRSAHRRSTSSGSIQSVSKDNDMDFSTQSIPSRFQPSRRTKSANELIDKHLSFIPNGWRAIIANTAKQLNPEDWDRSDARVLKKLEEHCPAFTNLEEILPNVKMAVPALRELMRDLGKHS